MAKISLKTISLIPPVVESTLAEHIQTSQS